MIIHLTNLNSSFLWTFAHYKNICGFLWSRWGKKLKFCCSSLYKKYRGDNEIMHLSLLFIPKIKATLYAEMSYSVKEQLKDEVNIRYRNWISIKVIKCLIIIFPETFEIFFSCSLAGCVHQSCHLVAHGQHGPRIERNQVFKRSNLVVVTWQLTETRHESWLSNKDFAIQNHLHPSLFVCCATATYQVSV